ncbi:MAG: hypothetical protein IPL32_05925 [Chloracidobacterium sp.]|nr:hypothetical protein [Chloracidobacterium sp.]
MVNADELREIVASHHEWLLVRDLGKTFPLEKHEIEIAEDGEKTHFGFLDDKGFHSWRLNGFAHEGGEITIDVAGAFAKKQEIMRLIPRVTAADLAAEVEFARLEKANEIAAFITDNYPGIKLGRVALNTENGRLAQINFDMAEKIPMAAIADVTSTLTVETVFTAAILWVEKLGLRKKKPVLDIWIICEKRQAKNAQKLHALLTNRWKERITVVEINRKPDRPRLIQMPKRKIRELWREKAKKLALPKRPEPSITAQKIIELSPDRIDVVYSKQGETLRFMGLPFARVRTMLGAEKAWFGVGRERRILSDESWNELEELVELLEINRAAESPNKRHEYYRTAPEAWLESILRRNIKLLDDNLILSPIYNQFRSSNDKIDLLALRKDGRLVIIELKTQPDREVIFQAADYWRKVELQRRRGLLDAANLFDGREILDKPALIYLAAPAWSFHRDFEFFAMTVSSEIELWRFELHENWRAAVKVLARMDYADPFAFTNR